MECVELLINEFHCDKSTKRFDGKTILQNACLSGHNSLLRTLVLKYDCNLQEVHTAASNVQMLEKLKRSWYGMTLPLAD